MGDNEINLPRYINELTHKLESPHCEITQNTQNTIYVKRKA